jgi:hypothetical protein
MITNPIDVSIVIPTFNRLWSLPRAVDSCRNASCRTEIIVVDDGSDDGTWKWLQQQQGLVAIRQANQGQTWAVNAGVARASGRYLRFLDSDDFLTPGIIDAQFEAAVASNADVTYSRVDLFDQASGVATECEDPPLWDDFMAVQLGESYPSHFLGMLFARHVVERAPRRPQFHYREDRMFLLEVALQNPSLAMVPGCGGYWVQHPAQMQRNYLGVRAIVANYQLLMIYRRILGELKASHALSVRRRKAACPRLWTLAHWIAYADLEEACAIVEWIRELNPEFVPPEGGVLGSAYRNLGFRATERLLRVRRVLISALRPGRLLFADIGRLPDPA